MKNNVNFKQGEEIREQLELPTLHFVVMDQWLDVIGEKALLAWLKFYTWCDRDRNKGDKPIDINLWEQSKIPSSFRQLMKRLGVGNDTFYNKIIKPLWNVGLIDIEEFEDSKNTGQKPMNIIVYKYPQNNKSLSFAELKVVRNYDTDYSSTAKSFAIKGGRPKKEKTNHNSTNAKKSVDNVDNHSSISEQGVFPLGTGGGSLSEQGVFPLGTGGGSQIEDNNNLNSISNNFNNFNNTINDINNTFNSSSSINNENPDNKIEKKEEEEEFEINSFTIKFLENELGYDNYTISEICKQMRLNKISYFSKEQMVAQARRLTKWINENKEEIREIGIFFVNGILKHELSRKMLHNTSSARKQVKKESQSAERTIPFYNWLES